MEAQTIYQEAIKKRKKFGTESNRNSFLLIFSKFFGTTAKFGLGLQDDYAIEEENSLKEKEFNNINPMENNAA